MRTAPKYNWQESDFAFCYPYDGQIILGPFRRRKGQRIMELMVKHELAIAAHECARQSMRATPQGFVLSATGPGVLGYVTLATDGLEADDEQVMDFALDALDDGGKFLVIGQHQVDESRKMVCKTTVQRHGKSVQVESQRGLEPL